MNLFWCDFVFSFGFSSALDDGVGVVACGVLVGGVPVVDGDELLASEVLVTEDHGGSDDCKSDDGDADGEDDHVGSLLLRL